MPPVKNAAKPLEQVVICRPKLKRAEPVGTSSDAKEPAPSPKPSKKKATVKCAKSLGSNKTAPQPLHKRKRRNSASSDSDPPRRKLKTKKAPTHSCDEVSSGDEVDSEHIITERLRPQKLDKRMFALENLRRKRQGLPALPWPEADAESDETESERDSLFDGSSSDSEASERSFERSFIVHEGDAAPPLPMEFSMNTHEALADQFKIVFQLMVHVAIRPPTEREQFMRALLQREEEYFGLPLKMARRKMSDLRRLLVASSWQLDFIRNLEKYPEFEIASDIPGDNKPACDACRMGARRACKVGVLAGYPYNPVGYTEPKNARPKRLCFNLGSFCAERTRVFHEFTHWEFKLFETISLEVAQLREVSEAGGFINTRDKFVPVKLARAIDMQDADGINEWFVKRALVDLEWAKIEAMMEAARKVEGKTD
ncbi:hypothetical protein DFH09DRAFT_1133102 [Mycena vulgaris]|nr:hypothetical protein DFH09DRAFT_1133102 [Mycena vulgaris]